MRSDENLGKCPLCEREMTLETADKHHLIPKSKGGKETTHLHRICHDKLHSLYSENQLKNQYNDIEMIKTNDEIIKFINWVSKKPTDFYDVSVDTTVRNKRRKYIKG